MEKHTLKSRRLVGQNSAKFQHLFDSISLGVAHQDSNGYITKANAAAQEILGLSLDQLQGKTSMDPSWRSIHEDGSDYPGETHPSSIASKTGKPVLNKIMGVINSQESEYRWIHIDSIPILTQKSKKPFETITFFKDISDVKKIEIQKDKNPLKLNKAKEIGKVGVWAYDFQTEQVEASVEVYRIFDIPNLNAPIQINQIKKAISNFEYIVTDVSNRIQEEKEFVVEFEISINAIIKVIRIKIESVTNPEGELTGIEGLLQDVTSTTLINKKAKEYRDIEFKILNESITPFALIRLFDRKIIYVNQAAARISGYSREDLIGKNSDDFNLWKKGFNRQSFINELLKSGSIHNFHANVEIQSKELKIWSVSAELITINQGSLVFTNFRDITIKKKAAQILAAQSNFALNLTDNHPAGIAACNEHGALSYFNQTASDWLGMMKADKDYSEWAKIYNIYDIQTNTLLKPEELPLVRAYHGETIKNLEIIIKAKNREPRYVSCTGSPIYDHEGNNKGALIIFNDITDQKIRELSLLKQEKELKEKLNEVQKSEFFLKQSARIGKIGGWEFDLKTQNINWTEELFEMHGITNNKVPSLEELLTDFYAPESAEKLKNAIDQCITNHIPYDLELSLANTDNKEWWMRAIGHPVLDKKGECTGLMGIAQDITSKIQLKEEVEEHQEMSRLLATHTLDIICLVNPDGTFRFITPSVLKILGYNQDFIVGKKYSDFVHEDDLFGLNQFLQNTVIKNNNESRYHLRFKHKNGDWLWLETLSTAIYKEGKIDYIISSARNITEEIISNKRAARYRKSLQKLTYQIVKSEEEQKRQIATNIHDHLSQDLVVSKMKLELLLKKTEQRNEENINFIKSHVAKALENSRKITAELSPAILYQLGIIEAVYWLVEGIEKDYGLLFEVEAKVRSN